MSKIRIKKPFHVYGGGHIHADRDAVAKEYNMDPETITYLMDKYGTRFQDVLRLVKQDKQLAGRICDCSPAIKAQLVYSLQNEMALTPDDIILRRLSLQFTPCKTKKCRDFITQFLNKGHI